MNLKKLQHALRLQQDLGNTGRASILKDRINFLKAENGVDSFIAQDKAKRKNDDPVIRKRMNDINTFSSNDGEVILMGTDEYGKDFILTFDAYNFIDWIDMDFIKTKLIDHIKNK